MKTISAFSADPIITSNKSFIDWQELFSDADIASAKLGRLLHHSKVIKVKGHSYRSKDYSFSKPQYYGKGGETVTAALV